MSGHWTSLLQPTTVDPPIPLLPEPMKNSDIGKAMLKVVTFNIENTYLELENGQQLKGRGNGGAVLGGGIITNPCGGHVACITSGV